MAWLLCEVTQRTAEKTLSVTAYLSEIIPPVNLNNSVWLSIRS